MLFTAENIKMTSELLTEKELSRILALWLLENDKGTCLPPGMSRNEFADEYTLPEFDYEHLQSFCDKSGDIITMLRAELTLCDWQTRDGKKPRKFVFYKMLKTFLDTPEVEPFPMGYIILK